MYFAYFDKYYLQRIFNVNSRNFFTGPIPVLVMFCKITVRLLRPLLQIGQIRTKAGAHISGTGPRIAIFVVFYYRQT